MGNFKVQIKEPAQLVTLEKIIWFGKHKNKSIKNIIDNEDGGANYICWMINSDIIELDVDGVSYLEDAENENYLDCDENDR